MAKKKDELEEYMKYLEILSYSHDRNYVFNDFLTIVVCTLSMKQKEEGKGNVAKAWNLPETGNNVV